MPLHGLHGIFPYFYPQEGNRVPSGQAETMGQKLAALIIEDSIYDAELNANYLKNMGYDVFYRRVETETEMTEALGSHSWDLILSDYKMPQFDVLTALDVYHREGLDIPFIVISGSIGEQKAVELIKAGAHDYLLKDRMTRFATVVNRELREAVLRRNLSEASRALALSEERYRNMINASPDGIVITDLNGIITEVSASGLFLYGSDNPGEVTGTAFADFAPDAEKENVASLFRSAQHETAVRNVEVRLYRKQGDLLPTELSVTLLKGPDGVPTSFMIIVRDISRRKQLETQLIHSERMAGLGEMASGIAHEINQPLNTISLALDNILGEISSGESLDKTYVSRKTEKIHDNIIRIRNIIDHIRVFSRSHNDEYIHGAFSINASIGNALSLISEQFRHYAIQMVTELAPDLPEITGNTYKFEQVILNLLTNARDAVFEKEAALESFPGKEIRVRTLHADGEILVEVTDNGIGIPEENLSRLTLPFFTTKEPGKGTGLGLSVSYQIVHDMNGILEFESIRMAGTTARIRFNGNPPGL